MSQQTEKCLRSGLLGFFQINQACIILVTRGLVNNVTKFMEFVHAFVIGMPCLIFAHFIIIVRLIFTGFTPPLILQRRSNAMYTLICVLLILASSAMAS